MTLSTFDGIMLEDGGTTTYFTADPEPHKMTLAKLSEDGILVGELDREEWSIQFWKIGKEYYQVEYFNEAKDENISRLITLKSVKS